MNDQSSRPHILQLLQTVVRSLEEEVGSSDLQTSGVDGTDRPVTEERSSASFQVPSRDLTSEMLDVPLEGMGGEGEVLSEETLGRVTKDMQEDLLGTLADFAFAAVERGDEKVDLSESGRFNSGFVVELMRTLPINPYDAPQVLRRLHDELLDVARSGSVRASWGCLAEREGRLELLLPQRSSSAGGRRLAAIAK